MTLICGLAYYYAELGFPWNRMIWAHERLKETSTEKCKYLVAAVRSSRDGNDREVRAPSIRGTCCPDPAAVFSMWVFGPTTTRSSDLPEKWYIWTFTRNFLDVKCLQLVQFCLPLHHKQNTSECWTHLGLLVRSPWIKGTLEFNPAIGFYSSEFKIKQHHHQLNWVTSL